MELLKRIKKNKKGFTLVEIIVVLVILAILAAFMIPAMLGFVNDANAKAETAQARECYVAAQTIATEMMAGKTGTDLATAKAATIADIKDKTSGRMLDYLNGDVAGNVTDVTITDAGKVTKLTYTGANGKLIIFENGAISYS